MRILLVMDPFIPVPPLHYGGIERVIFDIAQQYVKLGHRVTIVAGPGSQSPDRLLTYGQNGLLDPSVDIGLLFKNFTILRKELRQHDVIHNFGRLAFLVPFLKSDIVKVQTYMRSVSRKNIESLDRFRPVNLHFTGVSDAIVATGKTDRSRWTTVYNCAPLEKFDFTATVAADSPLVFLGRIERCKGLHNAIRVAKLSGKKLVIAGNISDLSHEILYFEQEIKPHIDGQKICYIGPVDDVQKNKLLGGASALLSPVEWFEPFPIIIPEAYACGTPVLGFDNGGMAEGIEHGVTGFISNSPEEMARQLTQIESLSRQACRQKAETAYSDHKIASDYLAIYQDK